MCVIQGVPPILHPVPFARLRESDCPYALAHKALYSYRNLKKMALPFF